MKAKLVVEGKEFDIEILDPKLQELIVPKKKTGYERVSHDEFYYSVNTESELSWYKECCDTCDDSLYNNANYYESEFVAAQNTRADTLMRQLRRFAVEHRKNDRPSERYYIYYIKQVGLQVTRGTDKHIGPWFDTLHAASQAIEAFRDELTWYFTEYKDSL